MDIIKEFDNIIEQISPNIDNSHKFKAIQAGAGLTRIISHVQSGVNFIIITAFRGENSKKENVRRNTEMLQDIKAKNLGAIQLEGHWTENAGTPEAINVVEISYFIPNRTWGGESIEISEFKQIGQDLRAKYDQESFLYGDGKEVYVVEEGSEFSIGSAVHVSYNQLEEIYSKIKGKNFIFSCVYAPIISSMSSALYFKSKGYALFSMK